MELKFKVFKTPDEVCNVVNSKDVEVVAVTEHEYNVTLYYRNNILYEI